MEPGHPDGDPCLEDGSEGWSRNAPDICSSSKGLRETLLLQQSCAGGAGEPFISELAFISWRREKSQHTQCISPTPMPFKRRKKKRSLIQCYAKAVYTLFTPDFFPPASLTAGQVPFVLLLQCDSVCSCLLRDKF